MINMMPSKCCSLLIGWRRGKRTQHRAARKTGKSNKEEGNAVSPSWFCWHAAFCCHDEEEENRTQQARTRKKRRTRSSPSWRRWHTVVCWHDEEEENRIRKAPAGKKRRGTGCSPSWYRWHAAVCWHYSWTPQQLLPSLVDDTWLSPCRKHRLPMNSGSGIPANESDTSPHSSDSVCQDYPENSKAVIKYVVLRNGWCETLQHWC